MTKTAPLKTKLSPQNKSATGMTPMMVQYLEVKERAGDALLFYRMGDFYELFFDDAVKASAALDITLTKRGQHKGDDIPMCGVPFHAYESYLAKLIRAGFKVAICEQMESPEEAKKRGHKAVVRRDIVRTVTPGTILEDGLLQSGAHNFLSALAMLRGGEEAALAWVDVSTGDVNVCETSRATIDSDIALVNPKELIVPDDETGAEWAGALGGSLGDVTVSKRPPQYFDSGSGERRILEVYGLSSLDGLGGFSRAECAALGSLLAYVELTQAGRMPALSVPKKSMRDEVLAIDEATRRSLEILQSQHGGRKGSLVWAVDRTVTGPGARLLASQIAAPVRDPAIINARFDAIDFFTDGPALRDGVRDNLRETPDLARALSRLSLGRGGPRDLAGILSGLSHARAIAQLVGEHDSTGPIPNVITDAVSALENSQAGGFSELIVMLKSALAEKPPYLARDGGFIAKGYDAGLDSVRMLRDESRRIIAGLEASFRDETGVKNLKIKNNNVLGYFVEVPTSQGDKLLTAPFDEKFIHRQTLASAVRFTTTELADLDAKVSRARDEALARELELFETLSAAVIDHQTELGHTAHALAEIDVACANSTLAVEGDFVRPVIDDSLAFEIAGGRHPVVEKSLRPGDDAFVANDCTLSADGTGHLWLMTGPNMAGKSTFLRQNAVIAILAQAGCFVPAVRAHIGCVDRVFSRVGASDDLARGRSTFMVEMVETAAILNQATPRSLVVLDEIGRGTSTFDGLSIAWAAVEHLHDVNQCRGLFATHYHELTALSATLARLFNMSMKVREWKNDVVFLHEVAKGPADRSYGVAVARLAGLPGKVVSRAETVLKMLEEQRTAKAPMDDLPLFAGITENAENPCNMGSDRDQNDLKDALLELDPDTMSPRDALEELYKLKSRLDQV